MTDSMLARFQRSTVAKQLFFTSPAVLGVGRLALASLLLWDLLRRWTDLDLWYTNQGLMPNHTMLWAPQAKLGWSLFYGVSELHEARFFVVLIALVYVAFLVGWRTKLMHALALVAHVSLNCRIHYLTNGGDYALSILTLWTLFLPLGEWLSVDAVRARLAHSRLRVNDDGSAELVIDFQRASLFDPPAPRFEWAAFGVVAQLAVIYFFNFVHKDTSGWSEGRVVHDVLHQDRIVTGLGVWVRGWLTPTLSMALTKLTLFIEASIPALLLIPLRVLWVRRIAVALGITLHTGFLFLINLGAFSATMIVFWLFLLPPEDLERVVRWLSFKPRPGTRLYFDEDCGVCSWLARVLLGLQRTSLQAQHVEVRGNSAAPREVKGVTMEQVEQAMLWVEPNGTQRWGNEAFAEVLRCFVLTRPLAWVLRLGVAKRAYEAFAVRRVAFSTFMGMGACGIKKTVEPFEAIPEVVSQSERWSRRLGLGALAYVFVVFVIQTLAQNRAVPPSLRVLPPVWVERFVEYTHFFQGWGMFAVSPNTDSTVVVRAVTVDGRIVDPLSERASPRSPAAATSIPDRLDHDEFFCDYLSRIADDGRYHPPLRDWLLAYPRRTGNPNDALVSFEVLQVNDSTPPMGQTTPFATQTRVTMRWPQ